MKFLENLKGFAARALLRWANPEGWDIFTSPTKSGVQVTSSTAIKSTPLMRAALLLMETIAQLPMGVFDEASKKGQKHLKIYRALSLQPNPMMTSFSFREMLMGALIMNGNFYAEIVRNGAGEIVELWPWRPDRVTVAVDEKNSLWYTYHPGDGKSGPVTLKAKDVLHFRGPFTDGIFGKSLIQIAREAIGLTLATEAYGASFFGAGGKPDGALSTPAKLKKETIALLKEQWKNRRADRMLILEEGLKYEPFSLPPEESQFIETRKFQVGEMARILGVPPHMIGDLERATFSNIEHQGINFVTYALMPWVKRIEQELEVKLLTEKQLQTLSIRFKVDGLLRGDLKSRYEAYAIGKNNGFLSANDIREKEDMPSIEGGDVYTVQVNTMPVAQAVAFWEAKIADSKGKGVKQNEGDIKTPSSGTQE